MHRERDALREFNRAFEVPLREPGDVSVHEINVTDWNLRAALVDEEGKELCAALRNEPLPNIAKEAADLTYVLAQAQVFTGSEATEAEENAAIAETVDVFRTLVSAAYHRAGVARTDAQRSFALDDASKATAILEVFLLGIAAKLGYDFDRAFDEVHRSNMSKRNADGTVTRNEAGKVLKGDNYSPADMSFVLDVQA